jgi:CHAT domain-containing protein/tetratricopeptide (TPR) repeat protein
MNASFRYAFTLLLVLDLSSKISVAQNPFQYREAYFLERRLNDIGKDYSPNHPEQLFHTGPDAMNQTAIDSRAVATYADHNKFGTLLESIDSTRRSGGIRVAEAQYLEVVDKVRKAQGADSSDEAIVLDQVGEFYLEERAFDHAYQMFTEALRVRRIALERAKNDPDDTRRAYPEVARARLHLADVLTRLGQLDIARGDLASATARLDEAIEIDNKAAYVTYENRLDAIYFKSLVLEKQDKWQEAEALWRNAIACREKAGNEPYWDAKKELAAMFARQGDFHSAAKLASEAISAAANPMHRARGGLYWWNARHSFESWAMYELESNYAMQEILAIDRWLTDGPGTAMPLIKEHSFDVYMGGDADQLRLYSWFKQQIFLQMSILLDGNPSAERVAQAYRLLGQVKGRYLSSLANLTRTLEESTEHPGNSNRVNVEDAAKARELFASSYLSLALDTHGSAPEQLRQRLLDQNAVQEGLVSQCMLTGCNSGGYSYELNSDAALIDFTLWSRLDRNNPAKSIPEYGAFVSRKGKPTVYIRLGNASKIDDALNGMELEVDGFFQNGSNRPAELRNALRNLHSLILMPLENSLAGASKLLVISDGRLSMAPLDALIDSKGHYFLENHVVTYLMSGAGQSSGGATSPPVVMANPDFDMMLPGSLQAAQRTAPVFKPLPGAEREARYVADILKVSPNRVLIGKNAREGLLRSIRSPEILHLATHSDPFLRARLPAAQLSSYDLFEFPGFLAAQDPFLHSVIALAGANRPQNGPEDGLLTGLEIASLHLAGTKLVVLSSCQSASGKLVDGEGIPALRAAFSAAGAHALLMNLWPVDDEAGSQFMQFFYAHLNLGPAEAMRQTQLHMLNDTDYKSPLYWAGYTYSDTEALIPVNAAKSHSSASVAHAAPNNLGTEVSVAPRCLQFTGHSSETNGMKLAIQLNFSRIAGTVRSQGNISSAVYSLGLPGNEIKVERLVNGKLVPYDTSYGASARLIIQKVEGNTAITLQVFPSNLMLVLQGTSDLLPTVDLPETFPPLSSYRSAGVSSLDGPLIIDSFGACVAGASRQSGDSKNPTTEPDKSVRAPDAKGNRGNPSAKPSVNPTQTPKTSAGDVSAAGIPNYASIKLKPHCFKLSGVSSAYPGFDIRFTARITLSNASTRRTSDNNSIAYDLNLPGNEVTISPEVDQKPAEGSITSKRTDTLMLVMARDNNSSTLVLQIGSTKPASYIMLKGPLNLFSTLDIPQALPPLSAYTDAKIVLQDIPATIDAIGACDLASAEIDSAGNQNDGTASAGWTASGYEPKTYNVNEVLIVPRCFQFAGVSNTFSGFTTRFTARMTLGGVTHQLLRSDRIAIYNIQLPGNEVAIVSDINGTQSTGGMYASKSEGTTLVMQRTREQSSLSVRISGGTLEWIKLSGPPTLFPAVDIPEVLPPLSSYTEASVLGSKPEKIGYCDPAPLVQYNDGVIRRAAPQPVAAGGSAENKNEAAAPGSPVAPPSAKVVLADPNLNLARRVLSYALHGDTQSVFQAAAPQANREAIAGMVTRLSGLAKEMGHCQAEAEAIEVHKILWAGKGQPPIPAYVVIGDCEKARPRLLMFIDPNGLITRTGTGGFVSKSTKDQIEQKAQALAESLLHSDFATFSKNLSHALEGQSQSIPGIVNALVQNLGGFERIVASQKYPYADIVVVTALYQRGAISVEIAFDPSLKIAGWYVQIAGKPRYFWQEFWDVK